MTQNETCPQCGEPLPSDAPGGACPKCLLGIGLNAGAGATVSFSSPPGQPFTAPTPADIAAHFPQLEMLELLGQGGMGAVYKARQPNLDRLVAVKILPPQFSSTPGFADRFAREARALARLSHPNIVTVYDSGETDGLFFLIMEFIDGANLREMIQAGELSPVEAMAIVPQICEALQFAHSNGIVHRDIKPENILVDKSGRVRIADFGLAKLLANSPDDFTLTHTHQTMGTPRYMAPEQIEGAHQVDHRADIYSLGVVFYELLTGELPLGRFDPPSHKVQVDVRLDEVVLRTLEKSPDRRYQQASEIKTDVESIERQEASAANVVTTPAAKSPPPHEAKEQRVAEGRYINRGFGIGMTWYAALGLIFGLAGVAWFAVEKATTHHHSGPYTLEAAINSFGVAAIYAAFALAVGIQALRLRGRTFLLIASAAIALPAPLTLMFSTNDVADFKPHVHLFVCMAGIPFGIWGVVILRRNDVIAAYLQAFRERVAGDSSRSVNELQDDEVRRRILMPASGILVAGVIDLIASLAFAGLAFSPEDQPLIARAIVILLSMLLTAASLMIIGAGADLLRLKRTPHGDFAMMLSLILPPGLLLTIPCVIWLWSLLERREIKNAFAEAKRKRDEQADTHLDGRDGQNASRPAKQFTYDMIEAAESLKTPGMGLIISGVLVVLLCIPTAGVLIEVIVEEFFGKQHSDAPTSYVIAGLLALLSIVLASLQITAGIFMRRCRRRGVCIAGAIAAMLPISLVWIITAPLGLWALVLLLQEDAREAFAEGVKVDPPQVAPAKQRVLQDSPYYAAGWLLGQLIQSLSSTSFVIALCLIGMATILLPWGSTFHEQPDRSWYGPWQYGWDYGTSQAIAGGFLGLLLFLVATNGMRQLQRWQPLAIGCFAMPLLALASSFHRLEGWWLNLDSMDSISASIEPQGGNFVAMGVAIALLVCAAMQLRNITTSTSHSAY